MKNKKFGKLVFLSLMMLAVSCSPTHKVLKHPIKEQGDKYLIEKLDTHKSNFDYYSAKFSASYTVNKKKTDFSGSIRIKTDSIIWISISPLLNIEAARIIFTPDTVGFINRINKTYFLNSMAYINNFLNKSLDYSMIQSLLVGNDFLLYETNSFKASIDNQLYKLNTVNRRKIKKYVRKNSDDINIPFQTIWLNPETYKIAKVMIKESSADERSFTSYYQDFIEVDNQILPSKALFILDTDKDKIEISISFSKISINQPLTFPFNISSGFNKMNELNINLQ